MCFSNGIFLTKKVSCQQIVDLFTMHSNNRDSFSGNNLNIQKQLINDFSLIACCRTTWLNRTVVFLLVIVAICSSNSLLRMSFFPVMVTLSQVSPQGDVSFLQVLIIPVTTVVVIRPNMIWLPLA